MCKSILKTTDNVFDLFDYIFSQLFRELIFIEGKVASLTYADLKTYQFLDNPQHVALELRSTISDDEVTKVSVAELTEEALGNITVISHKFLIPYRWDGTYACDWSLLKWIIIRMD